jgi:prepilin-type processing-associated H-X9-DG protein
MLLHRSSSTGSTRGKGVLFGGMRKVLLILCASMDRDRLTRSQNDATTTTTRCRHGFSTTVLWWDGRGRC